MEYLIGLLLAIVVVVFAALIGLDRERSFYATVVIVNASYLRPVRGHGWFTAYAHHRNSGRERFLCSRRIWFQRKSLAPGRCFGRAWNI
ncbi:MAG TPA: hypothetical protein VGJ51_14260 [Candidatus Angelobacter sp.]